MIPFANATQPSHSRSTNLPSPEILSHQTDSSHAIAKSICLNFIAIATSFFANTKAMDPVPSVNATPPSRTRRTNSRPHCLLREREPSSTIAKHTRHHQYQSSQTCFGWSETHPRPRLIVPTNL